MLEETGTVTRVEGESIWVETIRQSACEGCRASKGCGQKALASIGQGKRFQVKVKNPRHLVLREGQPVVLGLEDSALLSASALVYLLPLVLMLGAAMLVDSMIGSEGLTILAALAGLAGGMLLARTLASRSQNQCRFEPEVLRTVS